jgi:hypothetical protein
MLTLVLLQSSVEGSRNALWWFWLLVAGAFIVVITYLVGRIGPRGPWMR